MIKFKTKGKPIRIEVDHFTDSELKKFVKKTGEDVYNEEMQVATLIGYVD